MACYEVKSSEFISETYINDAALQYHVITSCGIKLLDFSIIHLSTHHSEIDPLMPSDELFRITSLKEECMKRQSSIAAKIAEISDTLALPGIPMIKRGSHCTNPYPCDFIGWCSKKDQKRSGRGCLVDRHAKVPHFPFFQFPFLALIVFCFQDIILWTTCIERTAF